VYKKREFLTVVAWLPAALLLAALTWRVQAAGGQMAADVYWADTVAAVRSAPLSALMHKLHALQGKFVAAAVLLWAAVLMWKQRWRSLLLFAAMVPGGMLANSGLKMLVERPRPALPAAVASHGFAYPSGHTAAITLFCGYLVVEVFRRTPKWSWRIAATAGALAVVAMVAFSRVYLGVHQPTDVVAALLLGVAWLGLCLSGAQRMGRAAHSTAP
jgi:membrane-associated phospholipid phosphatase